MLFAVDTAIMQLAKEYGMEVMAMCMPCGPLHAPSERQMR